MVITDRLGGQLAAGVQAQAGDLLAQFEGAEDVVVVQARHDPDRRLIRARLRTKGFRVGEVMSGMPRPICTTSLRGTARISSNT